MLLSNRKIFFSFSGMLRSISTSPKLRCHAIVVHRDTDENNPDTPFEFTEANMKRVHAIIQNYPEGCQRSAICATMDLVQRQIGWVPISAMHKVAEIMKIPRIRVYEWATFYTIVKRSYKGKYNIKVCTTTPCMIRGSDTILEAVEDAACCPNGYVSGDGIFSVETVQCQGACANAPVIAIDDDYYEDVTVGDVRKIISTIKSGCIPFAGPQNGRCAAEPITGQTTLCEDPPPPGFRIQSCFVDCKPK